MLSLYYRMSACQYRWWEVFGDWPTPRPLRRPQLTVASARRLTQERVGMAQRRARKRRAFVHNLARKQ